MQKDEARERADIADLVVAQIETGEVREPCQPTDVADLVSVKAEILQACEPRKQSTSGQVPCPP